jgi:hypothetical protein
MSNSILAKEAKRFKDIVTVFEGGQGWAHHRVMICGIREIYGQQS